MFIVFIFSKIKCIFTKVKVDSMRNQILKNNEYIKNNKEKIDVIIKNNSELALGSRIGMIFTGLMFVVLEFFTFNLFINQAKWNFTIMANVCGIIVILCTIIELTISKNYKNSFKEKIVKGILKDYNSMLNYFPEKGIPEEEYDACKFKDKYDNYYSEDLITDNTNLFRFADVRTEVEYEDNDGHKSRTIVYSGSLACISIKNINCRIFLGNVKNNILSSEDYKKINFENEEFNKLFPTYTDDELTAYKILTPDVMERFSNLKKDAFTDIDIRFLNNKLYIRFVTGDGFTPSLFNPALEKKSIYTSIAVLEEVISTLSMVRDILEDKNLL